MLPALPAFGDPPSVATREIVVGGWAAPDVNRRSLQSTVDTADGWRESTPVDAGDAVLVGARLDPDVSIEVRSLRDGSWGAWMPLLPVADESADLVTAEAGRIDATASQPVWIGPSELVQFRAQGEPGALDATLVDVRGGDGLGWVPPELRAGAAHAATSQPGIISRASWGADESRRRYTPRYAPRVRFAVVHHTAGTNDYTCDQSDDILRAIYAYHLGNGWDDIAYNFLIDRCGNVFEGRAGGIREAVIGGHAAGWNGGSTGVSVLGNFDVVAPTAETVAALERLVAWKLDLHHVDPHGTTTEISGGGGSNRHSPGDVVELPTIIGHRHTNKTACPGGHLYDVVAGLNGHTSLAHRVDAMGHPKAYGGLPQRREQPQYGIRPVWDVAFSRAVDWRLDIRRSGDGALVRSVSGTGATEVDLSWDMRTSDAPDAPFAPPGDYVAELSGTSGGKPITPVRTEFKLTAPAERLGGTERIGTAVELSKWAFPSAERVVIASAEAFPDALVATPFAGSLGSPVLLVPSGHVPAAVAAEIRRLHASTAYVIGGESRISKEVETGLRRAGIKDVQRIAGPTRFDTAALVAERVIIRERPNEALLALGAHADPSRAFPDAVAAGAFGASLDLPVLLTAPDHLPGPTAAVLDALRPSWLTLFGGGAAISADIEHAAAAAAHGADRRRFDGGDRFDTARKAAENLLARWDRRRPDPYVDPTGLEAVLASGQNWPDALGAGAAAANRGAVFLIVPSAELPAGGASAAYLEGHSARLAHTVVAGGRAAVADGVLTAVAEIVASDGPHLDARVPWGTEPVDGGG